MFVGELISLGVALSWTATALFAEVGFFTVLVLFNKDGMAKLRHAVGDRKAMWCVLASIRK